MIEKIIYYTLLGVFGFPVLIFFGSFLFFIIGLLNSILIILFSIFGSEYLDYLKVSFGFINTALIFLSFYLLIKKK